MAASGCHLPLRLSAPSIAKETVNEVLAFKGADSSTGLTVSVGEVLFPGLKMTSTLETKSWIEGVSRSEQRGQESLYFDLPIRSR